ncbi:MAG: Uncharacterized protein CEN91_192, partial [Candidatus Berkelbacteria bacterium Licking1014_85]
MGRKRKYTRHNAGGWLNKFDWTVDPQTIREIVAIILFVAGILTVLSMFNLSGAIGENIMTLIVNLFGISGFIVPLIFLGLAVYFWKEREQGFRILQIFGIILLFWFIPGLFLSRGGAIGENISATFLSSFGSIGGYVILLGLSFASFVLATHISLRT